MDYARPRRLARFGRDRFVYAAGHRYHLVEAGRGPALLLLPGTLETYRTWKEVLGVGDAPQVERPAWFGESGAPWLRSGRLPRGRLAAPGENGVRRLTLR